MSGPAPRPRRVAAATGAWVLLALGLALCALGVWLLPGDGLRSLDWQPGRALQQPWRLWTAAWVHWSPQHLAINLSGAALLAALGRAARVGWGAAAAWLLAWPLTHAGLWVRPELAHYGGLSGVLHAGAAVVAVHLLAGREPGRRAAGAALLLGLGAKLLHEAPWGPVLQPLAGSNLSLAPWAHASGVLAGLASAAAMAAVRPVFSRAGAGPAPAPPPATPRCAGRWRT